MRKAWFLGLLAATAALPAPALAQDDAEQLRQERQAQREQRRQERQEQRQERREERRQDEPAPQVEAPPVVVEQPRRERAERREERQEVREVRQERREQRDQPLQGWIGDPNDPRMEAHRRRYEQLDRRNARQHGTPEQYRELVRQQGSQLEARQERREERREVRRDRREDRRDDRREWRDDRRDNRDDWRDDRRDYRQDRREWNRDWRRDQRFDWRRYRDYNRQIFRARPYYAPYRGYGYNRFSIGMILDRLFWGRNYWISDPWQYRLPPAPYGYQWVRYYNDVVLVDTYSGRIVDVIYDFFW
jgi:hypothetical protein